ncbi:MAG: response regulator [Maribacter litoralis]|uniref:response regulator n=1 Tax=Maribacter litoralis TaxID=2059726 RepID=UPI003299B5F7
MIDYSIFSPLAYADDDEDDRMFFSDAMNEIFPGINMKLFHNGEVLVTYLLSTITNGIVPKIIFLDLNMPIMNGFECLSVLKKNTLLSKIPVVIYSTSSSERDRSKILEMGATRFVTKEMSFKKMLLQLKATMDDLYCNELNSKLI